MHYQALKTRMNIFKSKSLTWWQVGILKLCVVCFGAAIGSYLHEWIAPYIGLLLVVGAVCAVYIAWVWVGEK